MTLVQEIRKIDRLEFTLRPTTMEDLDAVVALINKGGVDQTGHPLTDAVEVKADWVLPSFDLEISTRVAETAEGQLIGYIEVWDIDAIPVLNWVWAQVDPQFEGLGVGTEMMEWAEDRLQATLERAPEGTRIAYRSGALSSHKPSKALFEGLDMQFVRRFWHMMIEFDGPPPEPVWPDGITLSSYAERPDLRAIAIADDEIFQDHWGYVSQPEDHLEKIFREMIDSKPDFDPALWFLAMDGEEIAGICLCSHSRTEYPGAAWVNILGVRRPWRKQGLGLALLQHAFGVFYSEGKEKAGLGVDSSSLTGATRLYDKAGMSVVKQQDAYEKEIRPGRDLATK
ncbi:MAG: GNAT family N-acetyltransferase [Candidatus Promineifilaceae bacterium]